MEDKEVYKAEKLAKKKTYKAAVDKGKRNEIKTREYFQKLGCKVQNTMSSSRIINGKYICNNNDFFGLFDHIVVSPSSLILDTLLLPELAKSSGAVNWVHHVNSGNTIYVQTKSNAIPDRKYLKKFEDFPGSHKLLVVWIDRVKEPKIYHLE